MHSPNLHPDFVIEQEARFAMVLAGRPSEDMSLDRIFQLGTIRGEKAYVCYLYASANTERQLQRMGGSGGMTAYGQAAVEKFEASVARYSADARWARRS